MLIAVSSLYLLHNIPVGSILYRVSRTTEDKARSETFVAQAATPAQCAAVSGAHTVPGAGSWMTLVPLSWVLFAAEHPLLRSIATPYLKQAAGYHCVRHPPPRALYAVLLGKLRPTREP